MAGRKKIDTETIKSNYGFVEASEQAVKSVIGISEEAIKEKNEMTESVLEPTEPKKKGRKPLVNREKKKCYSFTVLPSVYDKAQEKAGNEGKTLSELITNFLNDYTK